MISVTVFSGIVIGALLVTSLAPIVLIAMLIRDLKKGELW